MCVVLAILPYPTLTSSMKVKGSMVAAGGPPAGGRAEQGHAAVVRGRAGVHARAHLLAAGAADAQQPHDLGHAAGGGGGRAEQGARWRRALPRTRLAKPLLCLPPGSASVILAVA